jgi:hypothetical protein
MSGVTIAQILINDSSDKTITGVIVYDRSLGGKLALPASTSFPLNPTAGEVIWRTDLNSIYRRNNSNTAWDSLNTSGIGTPGTTLQNSIVRWNSSDGSAINDSLVTITNTADVQNIRSLKLNLLNPALVTATEGDIFYDSVDHALSVKTDIADALLQVGQEMWLRVINKTGSAIPNGKLVYVSGAQGHRTKISLANNSSDISAHVTGMTTHNIPDNSEGFITVFGTVRGLNTNSYLEGDPLYLDSVAGNFTKTKPTGTASVVEIGIIVDAHPSDGAVFFSLAHTYHLSDLHDVNIDGPMDGYYLRGDGSYWNSSDFNNDVKNSPEVAALREIHTSSSDPTGFINRTSSTISYVAGTRTFSITPVSGSYSFYQKGIKYTNSISKSVQWANTEGLWVFYFNNNTLLCTNDLSTIDQQMISGDFVIIAYVYWDLTNASVLYFAEERHGIEMDKSTHLHLHNSFGTKWYSGGALQNILVDQSGDLAAHCQFQVEDTTIADEDIKFIITNSSPQTLSTIAQIPIYYLTGTGNWRKKTADNFPVIYNGTAGYVGTRLPYNSFSGSYGFTEVTNGNFVLTHYYATNNISEPIIGIIGQATYTTLASARVGADTEIKNLSNTIKLISKEAAPLGTVIYQSSTAYANTPKARIVSTSDGFSYVDYRQNQTSGSGSTSTSKNRVSVQFCLTEDANNTEKYFYVGRTNASALDTERSGNNAGLQNPNSCSPYQVPFNGKIVRATLSLKGAGVQNGTVTYPVNYQTDLDNISWTSTSKTADIDFPISNAFTVATFSPGNTNYTGSVVLNISVTEGQMLGLKFVNGTAANLVGQSRNAFVTLIIEEA